MRDSFGSPWIICAGVRAAVWVPLLLAPTLAASDRGGPGAQTVAPATLARPLGLRYLPDHGVLWAAAPERAAGDGDSSWGLWHVDVREGQVQRIGDADDGMYDVVDADGSYLAAWFDQGRLRLWSSASDKARTVTHPARDKAIRTAPSWAPDGSAVAWVTTEETSGEGVLRLYQPAGDRVEDISIPAGVVPPEDTRPAWGRDARIIALVRRWGPSFDVHSQLLVWHRDDRVWRAWARPLPDDASVEDMAPRGDRERFVLGRDTYYTVPGMPVVLVSAGGPGGFRILYVDTLRFHGQREDLPPEVGLGHLFIVLLRFQRRQPADRRETGGPLRSRLYHRPPTT